MPQYAIFRVSEKKYKTFQQIGGYQAHMERLMPVPNSDRAISNRRLVGSPDIVGTVKEYIKDCKLRKDSVLARDILLTASPEFFMNATREQREQWVQLNLKWLRETFKSNCVYATLHQDEKTWHISALVCAKNYNEKKNVYTLANHIYFGGPSKLSAMQDNYATAMQTAFKDLNRGVKFSKAKHVQIRQFYTLINAEVNDKDLKNICAKAKNSNLLEVKVKSLQKTLNSYKDISTKAALEQEQLKDKNKELYKSIKELQADRDLYKDAVKALSEIHKIPQQSIKSVFEYVKTRAADKDSGPSLELKK